MTGPAGSPYGPWAVTQPGAYVDVDHDVYVRDPVPGGSLSASGVRRILPPSTPAHYRHGYLNPDDDSTSAQNLGSAAHRRVLGIGKPIYVPSRDVWNTNEVKAEIRDARAAGHLVLKRKDADTVEAMAVALRADGLAGQVFDLEYGTPEPSLFWQHRVGPDSAHGDGMDVWRRCRLDWLNTAAPGRRLIIPDYKTTTDASAAALARSMWDYGYNVQAQTQCDAVTALGLAGDTGEPPGFVLVAQETSPPYLVNVVQPDDNALRWARRQIDAALRIFARCRASGRWPGYTDDGVRPLALPGWAERDLDLMIEDGTLEALP